MPLFGGIAVQSDSDVDAVTRARIHTLIGGLDEELKLHRQMLYALFVAVNSRTATAGERQKATEIAKMASDLYVNIEAFIGEGRRFKDENGYNQ